MTIFEKIINGEIPSKMWFENDDFVAILDISPINPGHSLVIPKKVQENILSEDENTINKLMNLAVNLSKELKDKLNADGIKIVMNNGEAAGQEVFHTHVHLIPYYNQESNLSVDEVFDILKK